MRKLKMVEEIVKSWNREVFEGFGDFKKGGVA